MNTLHGLAEASGDRRDGASAPTAAAVNGGARIHGALSMNESGILVRAVERATTAGLVLRTLLFGAAVLAALLALGYTWRRGDEMVDAILTRDPDEAMLAERLLTLTLPVLLLVVLGAACMVGAVVLQSRSLARERTP